MNNAPESRNALGAGLETCGFQRSGGTWALQREKFMWTVRVRSRPWAGVAVDSELRFTGGATRDENLLAVVALETLPIADSIEMRQALNPASSMSDAARLDRIQTLGELLGRLLAEALSPARLHEELKTGFLRYNWTAADLGSCLAKLSKSREQRMGDD